MESERERKFNFRKLGIILGIFVVIVSIAWVAVVNLLDDDSPNDVTWVG